MTGASRLRVRERLLALPRRAKQGVVLAADVMAAWAALWLAFTLRLELWHWPTISAIVDLCRRTGALRAGLRSVWALSGNLSLYGPRDHADAAQGLERLWSALSGPGALDLSRGRSAIRRSPSASFLSFACQQFTCLGALLAQSRVSARRPSPATHLWGRFSRRADRGCRRQWR